MGYMAHPGHELRAVLGRLKSVSNEGHLTLETERVFRLYLPYDCSGVTEICYLALAADAIPAVQVCLKSAINEVQFTQSEKELLSVSPVALQ
jgi:hypothetical protein